MTGSFTQEFLSLLALEPKKLDKLTFDLGLTFTKGIYSEKVRLHGINSEVVQLNELVCTNPKGIITYIQVYNYTVRSPCLSDLTDVFLNVKFSISGVKNVLWASFMRKIRIQSFV